MCWRCSPYLRSSARSCWARSDVEHPRTAALERFSPAPEGTASPVFCIFRRLHSSTRGIASTPTLVACERRPARDLVPIRERAVHDAVDVLVQKVTRLHEPRCGIGHEPLIPRAV